MNEKTSPFQTTMTGIFASGIILGVLAFAGFLPGFGPSSKEVVDTGIVSYGQVTVWGFYPQREVNEVLLNFAQADTKVGIFYEQKSIDTFEVELLEEWARNRPGPDILLMPHEYMVKLQQDVALIPYSFYSQKKYKEDFIEQGSLFLKKEGIVALPVLVDPIVMYWNRTIFSSERIAKIPETWDDLKVLVPKLTKRNQEGVIVRSAIAFGEFGNIEHSKDIISSLILQLDNDIIVRSTDDESSLVVVFNNFNDNRTLSAASAFDFYLTFSNPVKKSTYTWDRAFPNSKEFFLSGNLAMYLGRASDLSDFQKKNSHLNFDVARIPQTKEDLGMNEVTFGSLVGAYMLNRTDNEKGAMYAAAVLSGEYFVKNLSNFLKIPPARRDVLANDKKNDASVSVFYESALMSRGWIDPDPIETDEIFRDIIINVNSGRQTISVATTLAGRLLTNLVK